ncbi:hypothetical protein CEXT_151961 [Caerostris extrusa]|uniref:Uncharacterized protein n=1 Tax=Caerostris extrusa TaxID=172846 RepID=A0AAV4P202_CAEEX|nr:hypothetical protein CEXT_151961 [Caerostris extrusa]
MLSFLENILVINYFQFRPPGVVWKKLNGSYLEVPNKSAASTTICHAKLKPRNGVLFTLYLTPVTTPEEEEEPEGITCTIARGL